MTPGDLLYPRNLSGYRYVVRAGGGAGWQASRNGGGRRDGWRGPLRATAAEAAQDYCDWAAGRHVAPVGLRKAGNHVARDPIDDHEVQAALGVLRDHRAQRRKLAQGYVYCIGEEGRWYAVKVGYSVKPAARVAELQTGNSRKLVLLGAFEGTEADEAAIHQRYMADNILLEWFRPSRALLSEFGINMPASVTRDAHERSTA